MVLPRPETVPSHAALRNTRVPALAVLMMTPRDWGSRTRAPHVVRASEPAMTGVERDVWRLRRESVRFWRVSNGRTSDALN